MKKVIVVGAGPAGLMAAEVLSAAGLEVHVYDAMPSVGRKFLLAGKGGLNLTHSEPMDIFASRYGARRAQIEALLHNFDNEQVRTWVKALGIETFVGTSGRVFPVDMKAAPLLRAWLRRLRHPSGENIQGVRFHMNHRWTGSNAECANGGTELSFESPLGPVQARADAVLLALGGGSWARLGSNGAWVAWLQARGVSVAPLLPSNCGFDVATNTPSDASAPSKVGWSAYFAERFAGQPFKSVAIEFTNSQGVRFERKGEFVATASGVEGSLIYAASSLLRNELTQQGHAVLHLDLLPHLSAQRVLAEVQHPRGSRSLSSHLKSRLGIEGIKAALLHELLDKVQMNDPVQLSAALKALPIKLVATRPIDEAISSAGGVLFEVMNPGLMLEQWPGVFCAGEMLDWEAPTGGYLLTACLASGKKAAEGVLDFLGCSSTVLSK